MRSRAFSRPAPKRSVSATRSSAPKACFQFGQRAEREHQPAPRAADLGFDLAAMKIGHRHAAVNVSSPAELQRQVVGDLAVVLAGEFQAGDLERALHRAEIRE